MKIFLINNRLLSEYQPSGSKYYYYTSDQINSTRIITDSSGSVVYSAIFDPYGGLQKQWVNTYNPSMKFSGKERETNTELDYFGARYYDHAKYRFISVDPVVNKDEALGDPQLWNLYSYCRNNPITYFDPDGKRVNPITNQFGVNGPPPYFSMIVGTGNVARSQNNPIRGSFGYTRTNPDGSPRFHGGIDIFAAIGTTVVNSEYGQVQAMNNQDTGDLGRYIIIQTLQGEQLLYAHLQGINPGLQVNNYILEGQKIGTTGISGNANNPDYPAHLHFEVRGLPNNQRKDGANWINNEMFRNSSNFNLSRRE